MRGTHPPAMAAKAAAVGHPAVEGLDKSKPSTHSLSLAKTLVPQFSPPSHLTHNPKLARAKPWPRRRQPRAPEPPRASR